MCINSSTAQHPPLPLRLGIPDASSLFKVVHSGEKKLRKGDLALLIRRFPAANDLTLRLGRKVTSATYEVLAEVTDVASLRDCTVSKERGIFMVVGA